MIIVNIFTPRRDDHHTVHHHHLLHEVLVQVLCHPIQDKVVGRPKHEVDGHLCQILGGHISSPKSLSSVCASLENQTK